MSYKSCMTSGMKSLPKGVSKKERGNEFCVLAKQCSKNMTRSEALVECSKPKAPKAHHAHHQKRQYYDPASGMPPIPDGYEVAGQEEED